MQSPVLKLTDRLRGIYTVPVNDGGGLLDGKDTFTPAEPYPTSPIKLEAAARIEQLERALGDIVEWGELIGLERLNPVFLRAKEALYNGPAEPGPAFIHSIGFWCCGCEKCRKMLNVPKDYIWQPATDWTAAGWVRERKVGRGEGGKERT